jgi:hypothetical protein
MKGRLYNDTNTRRLQKYLSLELGGVAFLIFIYIKRY